MMTVCGGGVKGKSWGVAGIGTVEDGQRGPGNKNLPRGPVRVFINPG